MIKQYNKNKIIPFNRFGFTLLEIITVLAIMGIVMTISIPVYRQIQPNIELSATARQITTDLRQAQQLAVTEQVIYSVEFNIVDSSYEIINTDSEQVFKQETISANIKINSITDLTDDTVSFNATGAALESGTITLTNRKNASSTIEIKPSGYVRISQ